MPTTPPTQNGPRRRGRPRLEAHRIAILDATAELLARQPLQYVRVAEILADAGVARGTFYSYFDSKDAVAAALLEQVMEEVLGTIQPFVNRPDDMSPHEALRSTVVAGTEAWSRHRVVLRTATENWHAVPELAAQWLTFTQRFIDGVASEIDRQRAAGLARPGHDSRELSAGLVYSSVHLLYLAGLDEVESLPSEFRAADTIFALWCGALYGTEPSAR